MKIVIKNGRVINPASRTDDALDILIENDMIADISRGIAVRDDYGVIDAGGCLVAEGTPEQVAGVEGSATCAFLPHPQPLPPSRWH